MNIQQIFNSKRNSDINLEQREYKGPLVINKSCTIDGHDATIWDTKGPVLVINAPGVTIKNLHVEVLADSGVFGQLAIKSNFPDTILSNVSVVGELDLAGKKDVWKLPIVIDLGNYNSEDFKAFDIKLPIKSRVLVEAKIAGVSVSPEILTPENNILTVQVSDRGKDEIHGNIFLRSGKVLRKIIVTGKAENEFDKLTSRNSSSNNRLPGRNSRTPVQNESSGRQTPNASELTARLNSLAAKSRHQNSVGPQPRSERPLVPPRGSNSSNSSSRAQSLSEILNQMAAQDKKRR